jgi:hypothetical protein
VRDQRDYTIGRGSKFERECPIYEIELLEAATLTVGETVDKQWTVSTRDMRAGETVTLRADCYILKAEMAVRNGGVDNGERVKVAYFGKKDPLVRESPHIFKVKRLDRPNTVNREKYAQQLGEDVRAGRDLSTGSDIPNDVVVGGATGPDDDIPFAPSVL